MGRCPGFPASAVASQSPMTMATMKAAGIHACMHETLSSGYPSEAQVLGHKALHVKHSAGAGPLSWTDVAHTHTDSKAHNYRLAGFGSSLIQCSAALYIHLQS